MTVLLTVAIEFRFLRTPRSSTETTKHKTSATGSRTSIQYHWHPEEFIGVLTDCIFDEGCGILYHHVQKSGGSTVESVFFGFLPPDVTGTGLKPTAVTRTSDFVNNHKRTFWNHTDAFCGRSKFSSYQVPPDGREFKAVAERCLDATDRNRFVILSSYREPISRVLSQIHQICNKNFASRPERTREACNRCVYHDPVVDDTGRGDNEVWDTYANKTLDLFDELLYMRDHLKEDLTGGRRHRGQSVEVLMMDTSDLGRFFTDLDEALVRHQQPPPQSQQTKKSAAGGGGDDAEMLRLPVLNSKNEEKRSRCSFGLRSGIIKMLKPAVKAYRNLTLSV